MTSKRTKQPWMNADDYGRSIPSGLSVNLLVTDMEAAINFQRQVLGCEIVYDDEDFAVVRGYGAEWLLHTDHTYDDHPMIGILDGAEVRGQGVEIRLYGCDPDGAEARARAGDHIVLQGSMDKPHGLRECFLVGPDGYVWVPGVPLAKTG